eukprot:4884105-Pyramimonas_sp.AAC.1
MTDRSDAGNHLQESANGGHHAVVAPAAVQAREERVPEGVDEKSAWRGGERELSATHSISGGVGSIGQV